MAVRTLEDARRLKDKLEQLTGGKFEIVENPWFKTGISDKRYYVRRRRVPRSL